MVDLFFWNHYYSIDSDVGELEQVQSVAAAIRRFMPGAHHDLGFNIYVRRPGGTGVKPLINGHDDA